MKGSTLTRHNGTGLAVAFAILVWILTGAGTVGADDYDFVVEPPPLGYPEIVRGEGRLFALGSGVYSSVEVMDKDLSLFGIALFGEAEYGFVERVMIRGSAGGTFLLGDRYDLAVTTVPVDLTLVVQPVKTDRFAAFLFGGAGGAIGNVSMTVTVPQPVPLTSTTVDDDTTVRTSTTTGVFRGGAQGSVFLDEWIVSLFGIYRGASGTYRTTQSSTMSYDYPTTTGTIDRTRSGTVGIDLLNTRHGIALSSLFRIRETTQTVVVTVRYLIGGV